MQLFKLGILEIDYKSILIFLMGLAFGLLCFLIIFLSIIISTRKNKSYIVKSKENVDPNEASELIEKAVLEFHKRSEEENINQFILAKDLAFSLMSDEARLFFPKSKRPLFELSIDEIVDLVSVVADNIEERLDAGKLTSKAKGLKIALLVSAGDKKVDNVSEMKEAKSKASYISMLSSFIIKKAKDVKNAVIKKAINVFDVIPKSCELIIRICGEECYKAFARKLNQNTNINSGVEELVSELQTEEKAE